jgi:hypothetical protein
MFRINLSAPTLIYTERPSSVAWKSTNTGYKLPVTSTRSDDWYTTLYGQLNNNIKIKFDPSSQFKFRLYMARTLLATSTYVARR